MTVRVNGAVANERLELNATVVHSSPGRLRIRVRPDDVRGEALPRAERALAEMQGVHEVKRSAVTNSVLLRFDPDEVGLPGLLASVHKAGVDVNIEDERPRHDVNGADGTLGDSISGFFTRADERVRRALSEKADLRTLVPIGLGALALREVLAGRMTAAPWYVLAWYAFDSFNKLRQNPKSTDTSQA